MQPLPGLTAYDAHRYVEKREAALKVKIAKLNELGFEKFADRYWNHDCNEIADDVTAGALAVGTLSLAFGGGFSLMARTFYKIPTLYVPLACGIVVAAISGVSYWLYTRSLQQKQKVLQDELAILSPLETTLSFTGNRDALVDFVRFKEFIPYLRAKDFQKLNIEQLYAGGVGAGPAYCIFISRTP